MALKEILQGKMIEARKAKNQMQLGVLSHVLGEVSTRESSKPVTDEDVEGVLRKVANGNYTALATVALGDVPKEEIENAARKIGRGDTALLEVIKGKNPAELERAVIENTFIFTLLPKTLSVQEIKDALFSVADEISKAKNEGAATGVAMKALKTGGHKVLGEDVKQAVQELRTI